MDEKWKELDDNWEHMATTQKFLATEMYFDRSVLGKILILPRSAVTQFEYDKGPWACISIVDFKATFPEINENNRLGLLRLEFDDIVYNWEEHKIFTEEQAKEILAFARVLWSEIKLLVVHCNAGMCRSPAVGKALSDIYQPEFSELFDQLYYPNSRVYSTIKSV